MRAKGFHSSPGHARAARTPWKRPWLNCIRLLVCAAALGLLGWAAVAAQQAPSLNPDRPIILPEANRLPDANQQMEMRDQQTKQQNYAAANAERKKQIADDST